jgi:hypothetical protein
MPMNMVGAAVARRRFGAIVESVETTPLAQIVPVP